MALLGDVAGNHEGEEISGENYDKMMQELDEHFAKHPEDMGTY